MKQQRRGRKRSSKDSLDQGSADAKEQDVDSEEISATQKYVPVFGKSTKCSKKVGKSEDSQEEDLNGHNTKKQKMESMAMKEETTDEIYCEDKETACIINTPNKERIVVNSKGPNEGDIGREFIPSAQKHTDAFMIEVERCKEDTSKSKEDCQESRGNGALVKEENANKIEMPTFNSETTGHDSIRSNEAPSLNEEVHLKKQFYNDSKTKYENDGKRCDDVRQCDGNTIFKDSGFEQERKDGVKVYPLENAADTRNVVAGHIGSERSKNVENSGKSCEGIGTAECSVIDTKEDSVRSTQCRVNLIKSTELGFATETEMDHFVEDDNHIDDRAEKTDGKIKDRNEERKIEKKEEEKLEQNIMKNSDNEKVQMKNTEEDATDCQIKDSQTGQTTGYRNVNEEKKSNESNENNATNKQLNTEDDIHAIIINDLTVTHNISEMDNFKEPSCDSPCHTIINNNVSVMKREEKSCDDEHKNDFIESDAILEYDDGEMMSDSQIKLVDDDMLTIQINSSDKEDQMQNKESTMNRKHGKTLEEYLTDGQHLMQGLIDEIAGITKTVVNMKKFVDSVKKQRQTQINTLWKYGKMK